MKKPALILALITFGLFFLAAACQQKDKGKASSGWHIEPAPSSAAGYGTPLPQSEQHPELLPPAPGYDQEAPLPDMDENGAQKPATTGYGSTPATPTWRIEPPPSAAGYGK